MLDENCEQVRRFADPDALNKIGAQHYRMSRTRLLRRVLYAARIGTLHPDWRHTPEVADLYPRSSPSSDWTARQPHARWVARMTKRPAPTDPHWAVPDAERVAKAMLENVAP